MASNKTTFKCHHYSVIKSKGSTISLDDMLETISKLALPDRLVTLPNAKEIRLETFKNLGDCFGFEFIQRKVKGLGSATVGDPVKDIKLGSGALFADRTAGIFIPKFNSIVLEYNHLGVRSSDIQEYINRFSKISNFVYILPKYSNDFDRVIKHGKVFKSIEFTGFSDELRKISAGNQTIKDAIEMAEKNGAKKINISLSAGRGVGGLIYDKVKELLGDLRKGDDAVRKLKVKGAYDSSESFDLNLLHGIVENAVYSDVTLTGPTIPVAQRFDLMKDAINQWI